MKGLSLRQNLRDFLHSAPGRRFQDRHARRRSKRSSLLRKGLLLGGGGLVLLAGLVLMPAPGPGLLIALVGAGLLADESPALARALDRGELLIRRLWPGGARKRR